MTINQRIYDCDRLFEVFIRLKMGRSPAFSFNHANIDIDDVAFKRNRIAE